MKNTLYTHLRKNLLGSISGPVWPVGTRPTQFDANAHRKPAHNLLVEAYKLGGGYVGSFDHWWSALRNDPEYDPSVFFLALDEQDHVIGLAQCWTSAFLKDLAVSDAWRRIGVGEALMLHAFIVFKERGAEHLTLKVENNNQSGAERIYRRLGMKPVT
jgi:ribosomal protein S18 acetylase RimI-like enzyme